MAKICIYPLQQTEIKGQMGLKYSNPGKILVFVGSVIWEHGDPSGIVSLFLCVLMFEYFSFFSLKTVAYVCGHYLLRSSRPFCARSPKCREYRCTPAHLEQQQLNVSVH